MTIARIRQVYIRKVMVWIGVYIKHRIFLVGELGLGRGALAPADLVCWYKKVPSGASTRRARPLGPARPSSGTTRA